MCDPPGSALRALPAAPERGGFQDCSPLVGTFHSEPPRSCLTRVALRLVAPPLGANQTAQRNRGSPPPDGLRTPDDCHPLRAPCQLVRGSLSGDSLHASGKLNGPPAAWDAVGVSNPVPRRQIASWFVHTTRPSAGLPHARSSSRFQGRRCPTPASGVLAAVQPGPFHAAQAKPVRERPALRACARLVAAALQAVVGVRHPIRHVDLLREPRSLLPGVLSPGAAAGDAGLSVMSGCGRDPDIRGQGGRSRSGGTVSQPSERDVSSLTKARAASDCGRSAGRRAPYRSAGKR